MTTELVATIDRQIEVIAELRAELAEMKQEYALAIQFGWRPDAMQVALATAQHENQSQRRAAESYVRQLAESNAEVERLGGATYEQREQIVELKGEVQSLLRLKGQMARLLATSKAEAGMLREETLRDAARATCVYCERGDPLTLRHGCPVHTLDGRLGFVSRCGAAQIQGLIETLADPAPEGGSKPIDPCDPPYCICEGEGICEWCVKQPDPDTKQTGGPSDG